MNCCSPDGTQACTPVCCEASSSGGRLPPEESPQWDVGPLWADDFEETSRPETPELEGGIPLPEELTGRASGTSEDLTALFANDAADHMADGFRGGSNDDRGSDLLKDRDTDVAADEDVTVV